jgi:hypothetical protein
MFETIANVLFAVFLGACFVAVVSVALGNARKRAVQENALRDGVELNAEIVGRYLAGAQEGSELAKARQPLMTPSDLLELELRYAFEGREIVARGLVSAEIFFRTRGMKTLKIRVARAQPEGWVALV